MKIHEAHCWKWQDGTTSWGNTLIEDRFKQFPWIVPFVATLRKDAELTKKRWSALFLFDLRNRKRPRVSVEFKTRRGHSAGVPSRNLGPRSLPSIATLKEQTLAAVPPT